MKVCECLALFPAPNACLGGSVGFPFSGSSPGGLHLSDAAAPVLLTLCLVEWLSAAGVPSA